MHLNHLFNHKFNITEHWRASNLIAITSINFINLLALISDAYYMNVMSILPFLLLNSINILEFIHIGISLNFLMHYIILREIRQRENNDY